MSKPTIATLTATVNALEARVAALEAAVAAKPAAPVAHAPNPDITLEDLASAIKSGTAMLHMDREKLSFSVRGARWRVLDLAGMTPVAMGGRIRAHCLAGRPLNPAKWVRVR